MRKPQQTNPNLFPSVILIMILPRSTTRPTATDTRALELGPFRDEVVHVAVRVQLHLHHTHNNHAQNL